MILALAFDGLVRHVVLRLAVQVAEVNDLIEHTAGGARHGGFADGAVLERLGIFCGWTFTPKSRRRVAGGAGSSGMLPPNISPRLVGIGLCRRRQERPASAPRKAGS